MIITQEIGGLNMETKLEKESDLVLIINPDLCEDFMDDMRAFLHYSVADNKCVLFINTSHERPKYNKEEFKNCSYLEKYTMMKQLKALKEYEIDKQALIAMDNIKYRELNIPEVDCTSIDENMSKLFELLHQMKNLKRVTIAGAYLNEEIVNLIVALRIYFKRKGMYVGLIVPPALTITNIPKLVRNQKEFEIFNSFMLDGVRLDFSQYNWSLIRKENRFR